MAKENKWKERIWIKLQELKNAVQDVKINSKLFQKNQIRCEICVKRKFQLISGFGKLNWKTREKPITKKVSKKIIKERRNCEKFQTEISKNSLRKIP